MGEVSDWTRDTRLVRAFRPSPDGGGFGPGAWDGGGGFGPGVWPATVPAAAQVLELGEWGIRPARWADLEIVRSWRDFLNDPGLYLRYLLAGGDVGDL